MHRPCGVAGREALFEEDLSEEQVEAELAPLAVQLAYAAALQGRRTEALAAYEARPSHMEEACAEIMKPYFFCRGARRRWLPTRHAPRTWRRPVLRSRNPKSF